MNNSHGTNLKQVSGGGQENLTLAASHTPTHTLCTLFFIKGLYHWDCNMKLALEGVVLCFFPREWKSVQPRASVLNIPSALESVSCVRTGSPLCLSRPRLWSKASTDPAVIENRSSQNPPPAGICWVQANASHSKSMNSAKKKKKMRQNRNSTWSLLLPYMCRQRGREAYFVLESCGPAMHDFICLSNCTQLTCTLLSSASIVKVKNKELQFQTWDHNVWTIWSTIKKD